MLLTCKIFAGRPVMDSWNSYALGTEHQNLPACVLRATPRAPTVGGKQLCANGFLPALYQGTEFNMRASPVHHLKPAEELLPGVQETGLDFLARINRLHLDACPGETELGSRIRNFELAPRRLRSWRRQQRLPLTERPSASESPSDRALPATLLEAGRLSCAWASP